MGRVYLNKSVVDAAYERVERVFDEFETVVVNFSGGKDSTVVLNIALDVAREKGRLPLPIFFIDQEAEWMGTIEYARRVMARDDVKPYWLQVEFKLFNTSSYEDYWLICWEKGKEKEWMREKEDIAVKENFFNAQRFIDVFIKGIDALFPKKPIAQLGGMRAEESPSRFMGLTSFPCWKDITWGRKNPHGVTFYPIYDWSYTDVWKFIHERSLPYNPVYDRMFQLGMNVRDMRISSLCHETTLRNLYLVHEIEPETWSRLMRRLKGVNMVKHLGYKVEIRSLPHAFKSWEEYRNYLIAHLIPEEDQLRYIEKALKMDEKYAIIGEESGYWRAWINTIITGDRFFTKLRNFEDRPDVVAYRRRRKHRKWSVKHNNLIYVYMRKTGGRYD